MIKNSQIKPKALVRNDFVHFQTIPTRWMDNDVYQHVNNVIYYSFFDTAVNQFLIENGVLDISKSDTIGLVVETRCNYFDPISFPDEITSGIRVEKIGKSSVRYGIGLFKRDDINAAAQGHFVHVYVDRFTKKPVPISPEMKAVLNDITTPY